MQTSEKNSCSYKKIAVYMVQAECKEPLHIGTGNGEAGDVLIHPAENRPFVQASGIAGALRDYFSFDPSLQKELFGYSAQEDEQDRGSRVFVTDGFFLESSIYIERRPRIKIDRSTGTSSTVQAKGINMDSGQKFEMELIASGSVFTFYLYLHEAEKNLEDAMEQMLLELHEGTIRLGGQKSNGCGYVILRSVKKAVYDFYNADDRALWRQEQKEMSEILPEILKKNSVREKPVSFFLSGKTVGSILVKSIAVTGYGENLPDSVNIRNHRKQYIIPASTIKGVIRSQIEKTAELLAVQEEDILEIFGSLSSKETDGIIGKARFYDSVIGTTEKNERAGVQHRIHLDKFTGGVMYGSLFSEKCAYGEINLCIEIEESCKKGIAMLLMALRDLGMGLFPIGSGSSIGRGYLSESTLVMKKGNEVLAEIDFSTGIIKKGKNKIEEYLGAL